MTILLLYKFNLNTNFFQYISEIIISDEYNIKWKIALDGVSLIFILF